MERSEILDKAIRDKNVKLLCEMYFGDILTDRQAEIVRKIAFQEHKRMCICAMTRWGKSFCVTRGIALYIIFNQNKKIAFIAPQKEQAEILMNYMTELILNCPTFLQLADIDVTGPERMKKEISKRRMTFKNGCEYRIFSAHGDANRLMGFGADFVVKDESCLIREEVVNAKIMRMLGDNPDKGILIELFNPWDRDNKTFEHWTDPDFYKVHISWQIALEEGRTTQAFIDEQKKELTPLEFTVLYDSEFPEEAEDSIFNLSKLEISRNLDFEFDNELEEIEKKMEFPHKMTEYQYESLKRELKQYKKIIACDPADMGRDHTVILWGIQKDNKIQVMGHYSEAKSESMAIVGKIMEIAKTFLGKKVKGEIHIDKVGIGTGPLSRLKEIIAEENLENIRVKGCHFGEQADKKEIYFNKKAENYFRLQALFNEGLIQIIDHRDLTKHLLAMKWELSSTMKKKVVDPEDYSPDWADALVYLTWKESELAFGFI